MNGEIYSSPTIINYDSIVSVACISCDGILCVIDLAGLCQLKNRLFNMNKSCFSSPIFFDEKIYLGCRDNFLYSLKFEIE